MKTCPICHARAFDDAEVCFGCLHRFAEGPSPAPAPLAGGAAEEGLARVREAVPIRASDAPRPAPCPFQGARAAPEAEHAVPVVRGASIDAARLLEARRFDERGWVVRFEFPGLSPVEGASGSTARGVRAGSAGVEELVVSLRPSAVSDAVVRPGRGIHARAEDPPRLRATASEGS